MDIFTVSFTLHLHMHDTPLSTSQSSLITFFPPLMNLFPPPLSPPPPPSSLTKLVTKSAWLVESSLAESPT